MQSRSDLSTTDSAVEIKLAPASRSPLHKSLSVLRPPTKVSRITVLSSSTENIQVAVRVRPVVSKEQTTDGTSKTLRVEGTTIYARIKDEEEKTFAFDTVLGQTATQAAVFSSIMTRPIEKFVSGINVCIFCYGQTGSGKTWTMLGGPGSDDSLGLAPRAITSVFAFCKSHEKEAIFTVTVSALEIYNESLRDLMRVDEDACPLSLREHPGRGPVVHNLTQMEVQDVDEATGILERAMAARVVGQTNMNEHSSRSHLIFTITLVQVDRSDDLGVTRRTSVLHLVDLAGSERASASGAVGARLREGANINLSLSSLGNCINALASGASFVPYRDSKLTRLLQNALGGNSATLLLATVSPSAVNAAESISTLRFADRAKQIKTVARVNYDPAHARLLGLMAENERLRARVLELEGRCGLRPKSKACTIL